MTEPNMILDYICGRTGTVIAQVPFYDPHLSWVAKDTRGNWTLRKGYGCGRPTDKWLRANPRPNKEWYRG